MANTVYFHYKDPSTGKIRRIPDIKEKSVQFSEKMFSECVKEGIISKKIANEYYENSRRAEELLKNVKQEGKLKGYNLENIELSQLVEYLLNNNCARFVEGVLSKIYSRLKLSDPDIVWLAFVKDAVTSISHQDPLPVHFLTARKFLQEKHSIDKPEAVDILARKIVEHTQKIQKFKIFNHEVFNKNPIGPQDLEEHFEDKSGNILSIDMEFIAYLKAVGGKKIATEIREKSKELYAYYKANNYPDEFRPMLWGLWVPSRNKQNEVSEISQFLLVIAQVSWDISCATIWNRQSRQHAALVKPVIEKIKIVLSQKEKKNFVIKEKEVVCINENGELLAFSPAIDSGMVSLFKKGMSAISSLTGHRLLRWQIKRGFSGWASGCSDPRLIEIEGGYSHIASLAGCPSSHEIAKVKAVLHAQSHGLFCFPDGSRGNMIVLRVMDRYKNKEPSKINIVLGDMLLPNYVFKIRDRRERRLVPIGDLPPLFGSKNTHAFQAQLQIIVFEEFSFQSNRLAEKDSIVITKERWREMAIESGLKPEKIENVVNHWCRLDFENCFLEKQGDEYRLASHYENAQKFLIFQGKNRLVNSQKGKASAVIKKKRK